MDAVLERLQMLEARVREALQELGAAREIQESLRAQVRALEADLTTREQALEALQVEREQERVEVSRLRTERDEIRARVEGMLGEIGRLEGALQGPGSSGGAV
jgi:chromosome segregation ATPase